MKWWPCERRRLVKHSRKPIWMRSKFSSQLQRRMKTYPRILGAAHATSSTFEHCIERRARVVKSDFHKDLNQRQVICPEPRRTHCLPSLPSKEQLVGIKFESYSTMQSGGEAVCEILDIFLSKSLYGQQSACHPYFNESPPSRSENPLIHDVRSIKCCIHIV